MNPRDEEEAFNIRANAGDGPNCDVNPLEPVAPTTPLPPVLPCDTPVEPEVEIFFTPPAAPAEVRQPRLPAPLTLFSPYVAVACPPGTFPNVDAEEITIAFGASTRSIDFADISFDDAPIFDQTTLYSLANVAATIQGVVFEFLGENAPSNEPERNDYIEAGLPARIAEVVNITKLSPEIISRMWSYILQAQASLDSTVRILAERQLQCGYFNDDLWVICYDRDEASYRVEYVDSSTPGSVFVAGGSVFSPIDVATANKLAILTAVSVADCQFQNEAQDVSCYSLYGGDYDPDIYFSWPTTDGPATVNIDNLGGYVVVDQNGSRSAELSVDGLKVWTYEDVASLGNSAQQRELINRVHVPENVTSASTQAEANAKARAIAIAFLDCFIPSREREIRCTDAQVSQPAHQQMLDLGGTTEASDMVLSEIVTGYLGLKDLIPVKRPDNTTFVMTQDGPTVDGRVSVRLQVPGGAFISDTRLAADANAEAFTLASISTLLDCNWRNRAVTYACDDAKVRDDPAWTPEKDPEWHLTDTAYEPIVPEEAVRYISPYLISLKEGRMVYMSSLEDPALSYTGDVELMASVEKSTPYYYETARATFQSPTSQLAADTIAAAHAQSQLGCIYCNPEVKPNCPPEGDYTLPLDPNVAGYSFDTTQGAPGVSYHYDTEVTPPRWRIDPVACDHDPVASCVPQEDPDTFICSSEPSDVVGVTEDSGNTPIRQREVSPECRFCNDEVRAACCLPPNAEPESLTFVKFSQAACEDLAQDYNSFATEGCAGIEVSNPYNVIVIPKCSVFGPSAAVATELALNIALGQLDCMFTNDTTTAECEDKCEGITGTTFGVTVGGHTYTGTHGECVTLGNPIAVVESGLFRSACSKEQANLQAEALANAQLVCLWGNNPQSAECPEGEYHESSITEVVVPESAVITTEGTPAANIIALRMAISQLFCRPPCNEPVSVACCQPPDTAPLDYVKFTGQACIDLQTDFAAFTTNDCPGTEISDPLAVITIPECAVTGETKAAATAVALEIAKSQLVCVFTNDEYEAACECVEPEEPSFQVEVGGRIQDGIHGGCNQVGNAEAKVDAGLFRSTCSKEQANLQAEALAKAQLVCLFSNNTQTATCGDTAPGDVFHSSAIVEVAVPEGVIVTDNVGGGTPAANETALKLAAVQLFCAFTNTSQSGSCVTTGQPGTFIDVDNNGGLHTETCENELLSADNPPATVIDPDTIITLISTSYANELAKELIPKIPCIWTNNAVQVECENKGRPHPSAVLEASIDQGTNEAPSLCQATEVAFRMAVSQLVCIWTNEMQQAECPGGSTETQPGVVEADTIIAPSTAIANAIALSMAQAKLVCSPPLFGNSGASYAQCPDDAKPEAERRWELDTAGSVAANEVFSTSQESADAIAESLAKARVVCKPKRNCNPDTATGAICEPQNLSTCKFGTVGSEQLCAYGFLAAEVQEMAQMIADATTVCCPTISFNTAVTGTKSCVEGICVTGSVEAGVIPSWNPDVAQGVAEATEIAQGIANALTVCCEDQGGGGGGYTCNPFFKVYDTPAPEGGIAGKMLTGGFVSGGLSNIAVDDYPLDVNNSGNSGKWLLLKVSFTAVVADDVLMPGVESVQSAVFELHTTPPDNTMPMMLTPNGVSYIPIGRFSESTETPVTFQPDQCGNITINHCPGTVNIIRS